MEEYPKKLEKVLAEYPHVPYVCLFTNGTLPLISALQTLRITGEVITTPYSFIATTHGFITFEDNSIVQYKCDNY